jgi:hypothetical protein
MRYARSRLRLAYVAGGRFLVGGMVLGGLGLLISLLFHHAKKAGAAAFCLAIVSTLIGVARGVWVLVRTSRLPEDFLGSDNRRSH